MDKFPIYVISGLMLLAGGAIFLGEWLCVEVAWRCLDYSEFRTSLAVAFIGAAVLLQMAFLDLRLVRGYINRKLRRNKA